jgi:hypothetical protein
MLISIFNIKILVILYFIFITYYLQENVLIFKNIFNNFLFKIVILFYIIYNDDIQLAILLMFVFLYTIILINKYCYYEILK